MEDSKLDTAGQMMQVLLKEGGSALELLDTMVQLNGMFCCGMAFSVKNTKSTRAKAYTVQQDIAKATRSGIADQSDDVIDRLSFEPLFTRESDAKP